VILLAEGRLDAILPVVTTPTPPSAVSVIDSQRELDVVLRELAGEPLLAVDTEAASFHRYLDRVYLLQISSRGLTVVVDPLAASDLARFGELLADPAVEIVFHDADYDLRLLEREFGFSATRLFDTRIAAQLLNEPGIGLAALLEKYFGLKVDKRFQRADWSARPLSAGMIEYAASDTHYLPALRDILRDRLAGMGRLSWAEEEFALLERVRWAAPTDQDEPAWLRMKGAKALRPRQMAVLRELVEWRDSVAKRLDRAAFRVMGNEPMFVMAKDPPADLDALAKVPGIGRDGIERRGVEILAAVQRGVRLPEGELPRIERPARRPADPEFDARLERLKAVRNAEAARLDLAPGVLCPNGTLEAIARRMPATLDELREVPFVRRWQVEAVGDALLAGLRTP
jgi:ribonuclease D